MTSARATRPRTALATLRCKPGAKRLSAAALATDLRSLPGWTADAGTLAMTFRFPNWHQTIAFVNAIAWIADHQDHHPDLSVHFDHCTVSWSTHDAGGITRNDCICAARVDALLA